MAENLNEPETTTPTLFSERLWHSTAELREAIDGLEFLTRLGNGSLELSVFRHYLEQDALYLDGYAKALSLLASRAPDGPPASGRR